jgi:hypothetical protein
MTFPDIFRPPVLYGERGGRSDFDQIEVVAVLKVQRSGCQGFGILVVHREVAPESNRRVVESCIVSETSLQAFTMG